MNPHVKEDVRSPSDKTAEIYSLERKPDPLRIEPEELVNRSYVLAERFLYWKKN